MSAGEATPPQRSREHPRRAPPKAVRMLRPLRNQPLRENTRNRKELHNATGKARRRPRGTLRSTAADDLRLGAPRPIHRPGKAPDRR